MDTNAGLIVKLCVFALDIFIIVFNFITLKHYLPAFGRNRDVEIETRNKGQQTYLAGDVDQKLTERRPNYAYRTPTSTLLNKMQQNSSSYGRGSGNLTNRHHCQKTYTDRDYRKEEKYAKSVCHCDFCKENKRLVSTK